MDSSHTPAQGPGIPEVPVAVNCPRCSRIFNAPNGVGEGDVIHCPFCHTAMVLRIRQVLVAEGVEQA